MVTETNGTNASTGESSFKERTAARLRAERQGSTAANPTPPAPAERPSRLPPAADAPMGAKQQALPNAAGSGEPGSGEIESEEGPDTLSPDDDSPATPEPAAPDDQDDDGLTVESLRERLAEAEQARISMEKDYRRKTQRIAATVDELRQRVTEAKATHDVLLREAQAELSRFDNLDWTALQADPAQYRQAADAWRNAQAMAQRRVHEAQQIAERAEQMRTESRQKQADISRDILQSQIPKWSSEMYATLREFAVETYDYTPEEVDSQVDWRWMRAMYDAHLARKTPAVKSVREVKQPTQTRNRPQASRDAQGRYQTALDASRSAPGDRSKFRAAMEAKLRAEKERRR